MWSTSQLPRIVACLRFFSCVHLPLTQETLCTYCKCHIPSHLLYFWHLFLLTSNHYSTCYSGVCHCNNLLSIIGCRKILDTIQILFLISRGKRFFWECKCCIEPFECQSVDPLWRIELREDVRATADGLHKRKPFVLFGGFYFNAFQNDSPLQITSCPNLTGCHFPKYWDTHLKYCKNFFL